MNKTPEAQRGELRVLGHTVRGQLGLLPPSALAVSGRLGLAPFPYILKDCVGS